LDAEGPNRKDPLDVHGPREHLAALDRRGHLMPGSEGGTAQLLDAYVTA
jgi:hypothetical protein